MKCVIYTFSEAFTSQLAIDLIPKGFEPIELQSEQEVLTYAKEFSDIQLLITEIINEDFLGNIRQINKDVKLFLLFHSSLKPQDLLKLSRMGVHALIAYRENPRALADETIENVIKNQIISTDRRMHVRIQPTDYERFEASIFLKGLNRFVHGRLIDISAGGAAIQLNDSIEASMLELEKVYSPVVLHVTGMEIKTLARLKGKRDDLAGFKFENVEPKDIHNIASYIHMRLQEKSRKTLKDLMQRS